MPRFTSTGLACLALALGGGLAAGCGADKESEVGGTPGQAGATVQTNPTPQVQTSTQSEQQQSDDIVSVGMKDIKFVPEQITAKVGQKIVWTNNEAIVHNVTATDGAEFESETISKDGTFEYKPTKPGTIKYVCTIHTGQNGQIEVSG